MTQSPIQNVAPGIHCIDTYLYRPGLAACYLIRARDRLAFVDTGTARAMPAVLAALASLGLTPDQVDYVIPTHVHLDHAGGAGGLMAACPNARLIVHPRGAPHLIDPERIVASATAVYGAAAFARDFGAPVPVPEPRVIPARDGQTFDLAGRILTFLDTPGHANHHGCIHDAATGGIFTGDTFGISYREFDTDRGPWLYAPTTPVAFDPETWLATVDRLLSWNPSCMYLTHYGRVDRPATLAEPLRRSIRALAALALAEADRPAGPERLARLNAAVADQLLGSAHDHGCAGDSDRLRALLAVDSDLNAQGLEIWLQRRAARMP